MTGIAAWREEKRRDKLTDGAGTGHADWLTLHQHTFISSTCLATLETLNFRV